MGYAPFSKRGDATKEKNVRQYTSNYQRTENNQTRVHASGGKVAIVPLGGDADLHTTLQKKGQPDKTNQSAPTDADLAAAAAPLLENAADAEEGNTLRGMADETIALDPAHVTTGITGEEEAQHGEVRKIKILRPWWQEKSLHYNSWPILCAPETKKKRNQND